MIFHRAQTKSDSKHCGNLSTPYFKVRKHNFEVLKSNFKVRKHNFEVLKPIFEVLKSNFEVRKHNFEVLKSNFKVLKKLAVRSLILPTSKWGTPGRDSVLRGVGVFELFFSVFQGLRVFEWVLIFWLLFGVMDVGVRFRCGVPKLPFGVLRKNTSRGTREPTKLCAEHDS